MKAKRRTFCPDFKAKVAIEARKEIKTISELAQIYQVHLKTTPKTEAVKNRV